MSKQYTITGDVTVSDGYHTMDELYAHRIELWITVCRMSQADPARQHEYVWRSKRHSDGGGHPGWFLLGMTLANGRQLSYHLPESRWDDTAFAHEMDCAPKFDGHTSADVLARLKDL